MRIFQAVLAGLAGLAGAQTDVLSREYSPMRTSPIGSLKSCEINNLQAICTCDWQSLPKQQNRPTPAPQKPRVVYMFPANGDSGSNGLYYYMKSFASYMMQNEQDGEIYDYRIVHRTESAGSTANPCNAAENGYSISSIPENIKRDMKNDQLSSFRQYYYSMVKEMTKPCVGNAYKAIQDDIAASGGINAVFYAVHPFSNENVNRLTQGALYDFDVSLNSDFINTCNNGDIFLDSALVINDGVFGGRGAWKDKLDNKPSIDRTNLMKCVLPDASNTAPNTMTSSSPCESYFEMRSLESELTQVDSRRACPMIPNFGKESAKELPEKIARAFTATFNALPPSTSDRGPRPDGPIQPEEPVNPNNGMIKPTPRTVPDDVMCNYDIIVALDLDCIDYVENPVIGHFAQTLINDIFVEIETAFNNHVTEGAVRVGIIGFHAEIEIAMNLFQMSSISGLQAARAEAQKSIDQLLQYAATRRDFKTMSFTDIFRTLSTFFDARTNKVRELIIVTNALPARFHKGDWTQAGLNTLRTIKAEYFQSINIRAVAVNEACKFQMKYGGYMEDCAYFSALSVIDSYSSYNSVIGADVLCPAPFPCPTENPNWRALFYDSFLDRMKVDLTSMEYMEWCHPKPMPPQQCGCVMRGHLECCHSTTMPGDAGPPGHPGIMGPYGPPGLMGPIGRPGPESSKIGRPGPPGPQGIPGLTVDPKPITVYGAPGIRGEPGQPGIPGINGEPGQDGIPGPDGEFGENGDSGFTGDRGPTGRVGLPGPPGQCGPPGAPGMQGQTGLNHILIELTPGALTPEMEEMFFEKMTHFFEGDRAGIHKATIRSFGERFVGLGNNGKSFCECSACSVSQKDCRC